MIYHGGLTTEGTPDPDTAAGDPETTRRNARADGTPQPQPLSPTSTPALPLPTFRPQDKLNMIASRGVLLP
jgi:hypothetical protein